MISRSGGRKLTSMVTDLYRLSAAIAPRRSP
jgi:hypothetical protein